ncbi:hypothetical protein CEXT_156231 [Caerostris extrusa]|uniref:Uncharacterized protein n=1 Tax=Caerostris extrusa TaxID=172846 RepID=A0AAV4Y5I9_CAEEX|nr:hypothetical protein CEXT_156231 [Caerostris extrusa]
MAFDGWNLPLATRSDFLVKRILVKRETDGGSALANGYKVRLLAGGCFPSILTAKSKLLSNCGRGLQAEVNMQKGRVLDLTNFSGRRPTGRRLPAMLIALFVSLKFESGNSTHIHVSNNSLAFVTVHCRRRSTSCHPNKL